LKGLKEPDISIRKSALDNLFMLATEHTSAEIINELLDHLQEANDFSLMEEMVLKVAILAERFAVNLSWYIDVIIKLIEYAGDYTSEDLWFRVAQMVTGFASDDDDQDPNEDNLKKYAALRIVDIMRKTTLHETLIKIGAYVLSEFGYLIAQEPGKGYQE
jgi:AP-2 complex subunit alpha